jgi:hypothetical protein
MFSAISKILHAAMKTNDFQPWTQVGPGAPARWMPRPASRAEEHE